MFDRGLFWLSVPLTPCNGERLLTVGFRAGISKENHTWLSAPAANFKGLGFCWLVANNSPGSPATPKANNVNAHGEEIWIARSGGEQLKG